MNANITVANNGFLSQLARGAAANLPGAILLSLDVPGILSAGPWGWAGALATGICARKTGNLFLAMGLGVVIVAVGRNFFG